jgi:MFS-type transporter involved in bile tolerance (Atg22 family)
VLVARIKYDVFVFLNVQLRRRKIRICFLFNIILMVRLSAITPQSISMTMILRVVCLRHVTATTFDNAVPKLRRHFVVR